jgi:protein phosphatase
VSAREARVGDRYLLCSDGLTGVVSDATIAETLAAGDDPATTADALISMALRGGAPDNVTVVVAEVLEAGDRHATVVPEVVGSAAVHGTVPTAAAATSPAAKAAALSRSRQPGPTEDEPPPVGPPASRRRWLARALATLVVLAVLGAGAYAAWSWSQQQYYVGADGQDVAIYRGLPQDIGPVSMSRVYERQDLPIARLPEYSQQQVRSTITADDLADARAKVGALRSQACAAPALGSTTVSPRPPAATGAPSRTPSGTPSAGPRPTASTRAPGATTPSPQPSPQPSARPSPTGSTAAASPSTSTTPTPGCAGAAS